MPTKPIRKTLHPVRPSTTPWWLTYLRENPIRAAFAATAASGGGILLLFFGQLGAMPEMDLAGANAVLLAVALVGFVLAFFFTICAYGGGWILHSMGAEAQALRSGKGALLLMTPVVVFASVAVVLTWASGVPDFSVYDWVVYVFVGLGALAYAIWLPKAAVRDWKTRGLYFLTYSYLALLWLFIAGFMLLTFEALFIRTEANWKEHAWRLSLWIAWCFVCNFALARPQNAKRSVMFGVAVVSLVVLIMLTSNGMALPKAIVRTLGLGELPVALVVTPAGCEQINLASGQTVCEVSKGSTAAVVCPVLLRSRIGSPYFVGLSSYDSQGLWPRANLQPRLSAIALPKSEVLSWSRIAPMHEPVSAEARSQDKTVTLLNASPHEKWLNAQCQHVLR